MFGLPNWHREQLCDLMAMVDTLGLPHISSTLTSHETFKLGWNDILDLGSILSILREEFL